MSIGVWQLLLLSTILGVVGLFVWLHIRILRKAGRSGWWALTQLVPLIGFILVWVFAFLAWPRDGGKPAAFAPARGRLDELDGLLRSGRISGTEYDERRRAILAEV